MKYLTGVMKRHITVRDAMALCMDGTRRLLLNVFGNR